MRLLVATMLTSLWVPFPPVLASVPPILYSVIAASIEASCDLCPSLSHFMDHALDLLPLFRRDRVVVKRWLQVLVITLPALLW
jgi:hypothetical protein